MLLSITTIYINQRINEFTIDDQPKDIANKTANFGHSFLTEKRYLQVVPILHNTIYFFYFETNPKIYGTSSKKTN